MFMQNRLAIVTTLMALVTVVLVAPRLTHAQDTLIQTVPRQVMVKIEWVQVGSDKLGASKEAESLTVLAEEGKTAHVTSAFSQNGVTTRKSVHILPSVESGNIIALAIEEETQKTDKAGKSKTDTATTRIRVKPGDTRLVKGQVIKRDGNTLESLMFVTPTLAPAAH
jgi:hypothetical protein